ncbi:MAG: S8 family serine peptidase [Anaerolineales bacterium]|nr:S8 family serine peptidase [Anaerolineales bacterium]
MNTFKQIVLKVLIIVTLCMGLIGAPASAAPAPLHIHPQLMKLAQQQPHQMERVILMIQPGSADDLAIILQRWGGRVVNELKMIHALTVETPAWTTLKLAALPQVRWVTPDAAVIEANCRDCWRTNRLRSIYPQAIGATRLWERPTYLRGQGVRVALLDSGYGEHLDLRLDRSRRSELRVQGVNLTDSDTALDRFGHGTHVAGVIGGNGNASKWAYMGVAPEVSLESVKVCGDNGACLTSDVIEGLQWIYDHGHDLGIRVVNLSINSEIEESYHTNPLCAALEVLWFNGFVVVVSAGNSQGTPLHPPANDPFVITVGAVDDQGTVTIADDMLSNFSAYGTTLDGAVKPDLVAPGRDLVSLLSSHDSVLAREHPDHIIASRTPAWSDYFRMSGTSMSAAVVAGAAALLMQDEPGLNPDQVKYRLMSTAAKGDRWPAYDPLQAGAGYLDIYAAVYGTSLETANTGQMISQLLWSEEDWANWGSVNWGSVNWGSVNWGSVNWGSVNWGSVNWGSVNWGSDYWEP